MNRKQDQLHVVTHTWRVSTFILQNGAELGTACSCICSALWKKSSVVTQLDVSKTEWENQATPLVFIRHKWYQAFGFLFQTWKKEMKSNFHYGIVELGMPIFMKREHGHRLTMVILCLLAKMRLTGFHFNELMYWGIIFLLPMFYITEKDCPPCMSRISLFGDAGGMIFLHMLGRWPRSVWRKDSPSRGISYRHTTGLN